MFYFILLLILFIKITYSSHKDLMEQNAQHFSETKRGDFIKGQLKMTLVWIIIIHFFGSVLKLLSTQNLFVGISFCIFFLAFLHRKILHYTGEHSSNTWVAYNPLSKILNIFM